MDVSVLGSGFVPEGDVPACVDNRLLVRVVALLVEEGRATVLLHRREGCLIVFFFALVSFLDPF